MDKRTEELVREYREGLKEIYGDRFLGVYLFGSYARGEQDQESDVDLLVVLDRIDGYGAEVDRTGHLTSELALKYGLSLSRVFVSRQQWEHGDTAFIGHARSEAIPA